MKRSVRTFGHAMCVAAALLLALPSSLAQTPSEAEAQQAYREGRFNNAVELYRKAIGETEDALKRSQLHTLIAWTLFALGREDEVRNHLQAALTENPDMVLDPDYYTSAFLELFTEVKTAMAPAAPLGPDLELTLAAIQSRLDEGNDLEGALADANSLMDSYPFEPHVARLKANVLERLGRLDEAYTLRAQIGETGTSTDPGIGPGVLSPRLQSVPDLISQASMALDRGDHDESIRLLSIAVEKQPENVGALELYARAARQAQRWRQAEWALKTALTYQDSNLETRLQLGEVYLAMDQPSAARDVFRELTERHPHSDRAWASLGLLEAGLGRNDRALDALATALDENPLLPEIQLAYGELLLDAGRQEEALEVLENASNQLPDDSQVLARLGQAELSAGDTDAAVRHLSAAVDAGFDPRDVNRALVLSLIESDRLIEASGRLDDMDLGSGLEKRLLSGSIALRQGRLEEALTVFEEARSSEPNNPDVLNLVGVSLHGLKRHDEAVEVLVEAINLKPDDPVIAENLRLAKLASDAVMLRDSAEKITATPVSS